MVYFTISNLVIVGFITIILPKISLVIIYLTIIYLDMVNWTIFNLVMVILNFGWFGHY
jgi:hypothetical protein